MTTLLCPSENIIKTDRFFREHRVAFNLAKGRENVRIFSPADVNRTVFGARHVVARELQFAVDDPVSTYIIYIRIYMEFCMDSSSVALRRFIFRVTLERSLV